MISDLLPRYYDVLGANPAYAIVRSFLICGNEVAWMEFTGKRADHTTYQGRQLKCECDFKEGVGWAITDGKAHKLDHSEKCPHRKEVLEIRYRELRQEYRGRPLLEVIVDLMEKGRAGELLEDGGGASFWGGYFYLQTVAEITGQSMENIWEVSACLETEKKISLKGNVVQPYHKPPRPTWTECFTITRKGWTGIASLPTHEHMPQEWQLRVLKPNGKSAFPRPKRLPMTYRPTFGPDMTDVSDAKRQLNKLIKEAMKRP